MFRRANKSEFFLSDKIEIKKTESKGLGIFAKEKIRKRELIESSPLIVFNSAILKDWNEFNNGASHILNDYVFVWENADLAVGLGYTSLYNHDNDSNAIWRPSWIMNKTPLDTHHLSPRVQIVAVKDIEAGEEICIHYNRGSGDLFFTEGGSFVDSGKISKEEMGKIKKRDVRFK